MLADGHRRASSPSRDRTNRRTGRPNKALPVRHRGFGLHDVEQGKFVIAPSTGTHVNCQRRKNKKRCGTRYARQDRVQYLGCVLALSAACKKPAPQAPPPPPPTPAAPAARPTVNLQASSTYHSARRVRHLDVVLHERTTLSLSPGIGNVSAEGTQRVTPQDSITYTLTCHGSGRNGRCHVHITVSAPAPVTKAPEATLQQLFDREVKDAYFDYDKADIRPDARDNLSQDRSVSAFLSAAQDRD